MDPLEVVLDANVLLPPSLSDLLLRLAEDPALYRPKWTEEILAEVRSNQRKFGWPAHLVESWRRAVDVSFPGALVSGHKVHITQCTNHIEDRHVLAAAIRISCDTIVTSNLRHFQEAALAPHGVRAIHPDEFLTDLAHLAPTTVRRKFREAASARNRAIEQNLEHFAKYLPRFAGVMAESFSQEIAQVEDMLGLSDRKDVLEAEWSD
jgi:hypothetical protein